MPDVTTMIEEDHRVVEALFAAHFAARTGAQKQEIIGAIHVALAPHAVAEEIVVYPAIPRSGEKAAHGIDEHREIKRLLSEVDELPTDDPARDQRVHELQQAFSQHVLEEERTVLPSLRAGTDPQRLEQMGELFQRLKELLLAHPQRSAPATAEG